MHTILRLSTMVVAALFLLYILVQRRATAASLQEDKHAINVGNVPWNQLSRYISDGATVTFSNLENVAWNAIQLPSLEKIAAYANELLKVINEDLNNAASELHIQEKIEDFRSTFRDIVSASSEMRGHTTELTQKGLTLDQISDELEVIFNDVLDHLKKAFPPPDQAPNHEERQEMVTRVLDGAEQGLLDFARKHGMSEDGLKNLRGSFDQLKIHVRRLAVIAGDLVEQHPILVTTLVFAGVAMLIPESWILRPLLRMVGFGPDGPIKTWAQRWIFGAQVTKGSWFAILQRAGMKGIPYTRPIMGAIGGAVGALFCGIRVIGNCLSWEGA